MAYGYHGDDKKIGTNEPIICKVTILSIKKGVENTDKPAAKVVQPTTTEAPKMRENKIETQSTTTPQ
jgi:hypothetical protein